MLFGNGNTPLVSLKLLNMIMRPEDIKNFISCVGFMSYRYGNNVDFSNIVVLPHNLNGDLGVAYHMDGSLEDGKIYLDYDRLNDRELCKTYIHEVHHHLQYQSGVLRNVDGHLIWKGKGGYDRLKWEDRPWEKDAVYHTEIWWKRFKEYFNILTTAKEISDYYRPYLKESV
jgi:hypothetical protein